MNFYIGRVFRNSGFGETGTIDVLLFQQAERAGLKELLPILCESPLKLFKEVMPSLVENSKNIIFAQNLTQKCLVLGSNLGSAYNTGEVSIPQIGTVGLIVELDKIDSSFGAAKYVWLGGLYGCKKNGEKVILPSDDTDNEELDSEDKSLTVDVDNGDVVRNSDYITQGMKIIKTKTCSISDYKKVSQDDVDYKVIPTENTFVLKKTKAGLRHNSYKQEEKTEKVKTVDENGKEVTIDQTKKTYIKTSYGQIVIDDNSFKINRKSKDDNDKISDQEISFEGNSLIISNKGGDKNRRITIDMNSDGSMLISTDGDLKITAKENLALHGKTIDIMSEEGLNLTNKKGIMTIGDNGESLIKVIYDLMSFLATDYQTFGNQAQQVTAPQNLPKINNISNSLLKGFATSVSVNEVSHS